MKIKSDSFTDLINTFQEIYDRNTDQTENIVGILRGRKNIYKHLNFLFSEAKKDIILSTEKSVEEHPEIIKIKYETKITVKSPTAGARICVVDDHNSIIFPVPEGKTHPDYDLCVWIKNKETTKFLKQMLTSF